jgi:integrase
MAAPRTNARPIIRTDRSGEPKWNAKWSRGGRQIWRTIGPAWMETDGNGGWRRRKGRPVAGYLTEAEAIAAMLELVASHDAEATLLERDAEERRRSGATFRDVASEWLDYLERVMGAKPSTMQDYRSALAEPGVPHRRGKGQTRGRLMAAFGDRPIREVDVREVDRYLRRLDREGLSARNVNKHRQVLSAIFNYARRPTTHALPANPVEGTDRRREPPRAALDFYEPEEIEALARAAAAGAHRGAVQGEPNADELAARAADDAQDAELFRVLAYTGVRLGEAVALRWKDVDFGGRRLIVQRALSGEIETTTKAHRVRHIGLATVAAEALARVAARDDYTGREDYVFCNRLGRRLDPSAIRRRFKRAVDAAGLRPLRLHGLRHGAGSLLAREADAVAVKAFLGHAKLTTTERYMHAKARPDDLARLDRAFAPAGAGTALDSVAGA